MKGGKIHCETFFGSSQDQISISDYRKIAIDVVKKFLKAFNDNIAFCIPFVFPSSLFPRKFKQELHPHLYLCLKHVSTFKNLKFVYC